MIKTCELKVVDVDLALELMGGYVQIYKKVVQSFLENQSDLVKEVEDNLKDGDFDEARRLVHSCKGISSNIGAKRLYEVSKSLENAIMNRDDALIDSLFNEFKEIFTLVLEDLNNIRFEETD